MSAEQLNYPPAIEEAVSLTRVAIEAVEPVVEGGRFAAKAVVGQPCVVCATIFTDGHEKLDANLLWRGSSGGLWQSAPMQPLENDRWRAELVPEHPGRMEFAIEAWRDDYATYCDEVQKKLTAGKSLVLELREGELLLQRTLEQAMGAADETLQDALQQLRQSNLDEEKLALLLSREIQQRMRELGQHRHLMRTPMYPLDVERSLAEFASWYELFPRSASGSAQRHGTFQDVIEQLPRIRSLGFDVLYFPPIHPIGRSQRKGRNNSLQANADDPGSPYAIGGPEGGHHAVHPQLGSLDDFRHLVSAAKVQGLEVALDFAIQCSPDHPWLSEHPGWFEWRPDGSIRHAENPPKKYEDIVNVAFYNDDAIPDLWLALRDVVLFWVEQGVTLFRVDNPHTKPLPFWEWLIGDVRHQHPEVIFLSEAFTRPAMMARLGKVGFSQSYTYFTWRNTKEEIESYFMELTQPPWRDCYRPNFFVNTPDINPRFLHDSGRAGFLIRAALATMGSGLWGMYSGFELCEAAPVPGKEEYLDSEKYQLRPRDYQQSGNINAEIAQLNRIRRENPALQTHLGLQTFLCWNDNIVYFAKRTADMSNFVLVAISLDPHNAQEAHFEVPLWEFGLADDASIQGEDLMTGHTWQWHGKTQWMRIEPWHQPFGIWRVSRVEGERHE
ncbi:starch synthase (maltosyl-transferring) [Halopseudomonas sabulinigri]|uniref:Alpha-1,4-glucan:maltose-1-phosphate maltosyltransferase n=1 Tax=Halopseudomonas sabulinigri TaxID=472181 RepID=A0A1H1PCY0_9GAMM|nr:alpha-1,4-glucan--maltose-1-phosphate maltosyltransferase [Halopseudomonas sabulinigri]SDS08950.1 starch synthase (maltosyl-transferring) [Halopseudomonas sabulinigri]